MFKSNLLKITIILTILLTNSYALKKEEIQSEMAERIDNVLVVLKNKSLYPIFLSEIYFKNEIDSKLVDVIKLHLQTEIIILPIMGLQPLIERVQITKTGLW
jgi:phospholipid transport system substrate-binding protein